MIRYLLRYRGKRSIDYYPAQVIFPPMERRDLWDVSDDGSPYTVVRAYPNFDPNPGDPWRYVHNKTHAPALLLKEMFEVGFDFVYSTVPNVMVLPTELPGGVKDRSITQPRVSLKTFALLFSLPPSRNSDPGSHSRLFSPDTHNGSCLAFLSREDFPAPSSLVDSHASNCMLHTHNTYKY